MLLKAERFLEIEIILQKLPKNKGGNALETAKLSINDIFRRALFSLMLAANLTFGISFPMN